MKKIIVVVGPTGVGKTSLSIDLAKRYNGEIISGDAYQIYQKMNIGTAKIKEEEKQGIKHYLVDELAYQDEYNVKIFQEKGRAIIADIHSRGKTAIICGGTGLYIKALLYDYKFIDEEKDEAYQKALDCLTSEELYEMLKEKDPDSLKTIHPNNIKRIKRALMMVHLGHKKSEIVESQKHVPIYDNYIIGLTTSKRAYLYERINHRVDQMFDDGLVNEVKGLIQTQDDFKLQSMRGIGYKEFEAYYLGNINLDDVKELIKKHTRNFAKRQYTFFNNQLKVNWYNIEEEYHDCLYNELDKFE